MKISSTLGMTKEHGMQVQKETKLVGEWQCMFSYTLIKKRYKQQNVAHNNKNDKLRSPMLCTVWEPHQSLHLFLRVANLHDAVVRLSRIFDGRAAMTGSSSVPSQSAHLVCIAFSLEELEPTFGNGSKKPCPLLNSIPMIQTLRSSSVTFHCWYHLFLLVFDSPVGAFLFGSKVCW